MIEVHPTSSISQSSIAAFADRLWADAQADDEVRTTIAPIIDGTPIEAAESATIRDDSRHTVAPDLGALATDQVISSTPAPSQTRRGRRSANAGGQQDSATNVRPRRARRARREERQAIPSVESNETETGAGNEQYTEQPRSAAPSQPVTSEKHAPATEPATGDPATTLVLDRAELLRGMVDDSDTSRDDTRQAEAGAEQDLSAADTRPSLPPVTPLDYDNERHQLARLNHIRQLLATEGLCGASVRNEADLRAALALGFAREIDPNKVPNVLVTSDPNVSQSLIDEARQDIIRRRAQALSILQKTDISIAASFTELGETQPAEYDAASDAIERITPYLRDAEQVFSGDDAQDALDRIALIVHTLGLSPLTIVTAEWAVAQYYSLHLMDAQQQTETQDREHVQLFDTPAEARTGEQVQLFDVPDGLLLERATESAASDRLDQARRGEIMAGSEDMIRSLVRDLRRGRNHLYKSGVEPDEIPQLISDWVDEQLGLQPGYLEQVKEGRTWQAVHSAIGNKLRSLDAQDPQSRRLHWRDRPNIRMHDAVRNEVYDQLGVSLGDLIALSLHITEGRYASGYSTIQALEQYTDNLVSMINERQAAEAAQPLYARLDFGQIRAEVLDRTQRAVARVGNWFSQLGEYGARMFDSGAADQEEVQAAYAAAQPHTPRMPAERYAPPQPGASSPARRTPLVQQRPAQAQDSHPSGVRPTVANTPSRPGYAGPRRLTPEEYATFTADQFIEAGHDLASLPAEVQERLTIAAKRIRDEDVQRKHDDRFLLDRPATGTQVGTSHTAYL